jgi:Putative peptidoglycan-binding domain-containing protein
MTDDLESARRTAESWHLGQTSARYESGPSGAGTVSMGKGDHGGVSYGSYQLSSKMGTLQEYLDQSPYGEKFKGLTPATPAFDAKWKELAKTDPGFGRDQHDFIGRSHYSEQDAALKARGIDLTGRGMAVQDALWSTSVQCRDLTPGIFEKGLKEKFGDKYDLSKLSDKDIVDAVQDYKTNHVKTLFSKSPDLHESLKERFANEKASLDKLADADKVLKDHGVTVEHKGRAQAASPATPNHGDHVQHAGTLRLKDHSDQVHDLQARLAALGYRGVDGKPLTPDSDFGANTKHAVEAFQRDHHLKVDGIVGKQTLSAIDQAQQKPPASLSDHAHVGNGLYSQALKGVHAIDAQQGRTPDQLSTNLAGSLALKSHTEGLSRIDHVLLSDDARTAYAVQGELNSPLKKYAEVDVAQAVAQPLVQSSQDWPQPAPKLEPAAPQHQQQPSLMQ